MQTPQSAPAPTRQQLHRPVPGRLRGVGVGGRGKGLGVVNWPLRIRKG